MGKRNKEQENAAMVQALLQGKSMDEAVEQAAMVQALLAGGLTNKEDSDDVEIELELVEETKKKKKTKKKEKEPKKEYNPNHITKIPECTFAKIEKSKSINVNFYSHDIPYKEQLWKIDDRVVVYNVERIELPQEAARAMEKIRTNITPELVAKAKSGYNRYFKVVTYESIPNGLQIIGYVEITPDKKVRVRIEDKLLAKKINTDKLMKNIKNSIKELVKYY